MELKAPERLETARLVLRRPLAADLEAIFERYASDPDVTRFLAWPRHRSLADTQTFFAFSNAEWDRWPAGPYLVCSRSDSNLLGSTGLAFETPYRASTGYVFAKDAWGNGYATEVVKAMAITASVIGVQRLYAVCHTQHHASQRVLEKSGFARDGILRRHMKFPNLIPDGLYDVFCYSLIV
jgi:ribosomal-protein-alanine N-acetyltransferase